MPNVNSFCSKTMKHGRSYLVVLVKMNNSFFLFNLSIKFFFCMEQDHIRLNKHLIAYFNLVLISTLPIAFQK